MSISKWRNGRKNSSPWGRNDEAEVAFPELALDQNPCSRREGRSLPRRKYRNEEEKFSMVTTECLDHVAIALCYFTLESRLPLLFCHFWDVHALYKPLLMTFVLVIKRMNDRRDQIE